MIGTRQSRVAFSRHTDGQTRRGQMTKENLTTTDFLAKVMERHFTEGTQFWYLQHCTCTESLKVSHIIGKRLKWMVDLWIMVDRYLLCACQHGSTSSVGSTGTGSYGAGQSDILCLTWISKWLWHSSYIHTDIYVYIYSYFLLSLNNWIYTKSHNSLLTSCRC